MRRRAVFFFCGVGMAAVLSAETIKNDVLALRWDQAAQHFVLQSLLLGEDYHACGIFPRPVVSVEKLPVTHPNWGAGQQLCVVHGGGWKTTLSLFSRHPFLQVHTTCANPTGGKDASRASGPFVTDSLRILALGVRLREERLVTYGTGGLFEGAQAPGSYAFEVIAEPLSRHGLVCAYLTQERSVGVFFPSDRPPSEFPKNDFQAYVTAQLEFGSFRVEPGGTTATDTLLVGFFRDCRLGLEAYADSVAALYGIRLKPKRGVYCTWYHAGASNEAALRENAAFAASHLRPFGLGVVQIDDTWQAQVPPGMKVSGRIPRTGPVKLFVASRSNYPRGMAATARMIASYGFTPGLWFMPFAGNWRHPAFPEEIFAKNPDGTPFHDSRWSGTCIDLSNPKGQAFVRQRVRRLYHWGYRYFKLDGLHTGMPTYNIYVNTFYRNKDFGKARLADPHMTFIEAFRQGLRIVRREAPGAFLLGCNVSQNMRCMAPSFGFLDAMRIGPDNGSAGRGNWRGVTVGAWHNTNLYFLNGRVWHNDPDPVYVRPSTPLSSARWMCSFVAVSGAMHTSSYQYSKLPPERLDLLKRSLPSHNLPARPVDLFERKRPRIWLARKGQRAVAGLFNWEEKQPLEISYDMGRLGLDREKSYVGFAYWSDRFVGPIQGRLTWQLQGGCCEVLALRERASHPLLVSTSRHITQGLIDVEEERWYPQRNTLSGTSRVVGGDRYELRVWIPAERKYRVEGATAGEAALRLKREAQGVRLSFTPAASGRVNWKITFRVQ